MPSRTQALFTRFVLASLLSLGIASCSSDTQSVPGTIATGDFSLSTSETVLNLTEGDTSNVSVPLTVVRENGHDMPITLSVAGKTDSDDAFLNATFAPAQVDANSTTSTLELRLAIANSPIMPHERTIVVKGDDGADLASIELTLNIQPTSAPDVYLLAGQSNMVGFSGDGTKQAGAGGADEPNARIFQLNATKNDQYEIFLTQADFTNQEKNFVAPKIVRAEDPLHIPQDPSNTSNKTLSYIGMGLSFAKAALNDTTANIILVPAAWSGSSFCYNDNGPNGNWNPEQSSNPGLGNTWLFDRALTRINMALQESGGVLRGILWHQGESDANEICGPLYQDNLIKVAEHFRARIAVDLRGDQLRHADATIPFITGTMSRGIDEREDLSVFPPSKQLIDDAHRSVTSTISYADFANNDDLTPDNGYPCGNTSCIHYGAEALRQMGARYYEALQRVVQQ